MNRKRKGVTVGKGLMGWLISKTSFYILFGFIYLIIILAFHLFAPFYQKSNDTWNDRLFSQPLEGELFPDNIILVDIDSWPYYRDNREVAKQARDGVVNNMIKIIDLLNRNPKKKPPFIGIDMTFESYANNKIMGQLFKRVKEAKNIFLAVGYDRKKRVLTFPRNYFWNKVNREIEQIKKRLMVVNLEKFRDEPVRRYRSYFKAAYNSCGLEFGFPSMGTVIAKMVSRFYFGEPQLEVANGQPGRRVKFRYLIRDIKEDFRRYNVFSIPEAVKVLQNQRDKWDIANSIVIFGRMDPDPDGRDRFPVCASIRGGGVTLPGVMIHINAAQSILLKEAIRPMGIWEVLVCLLFLLVVLMATHIVIEALVSRWKPGMSHWYPDIFLFFAFGFFILFMDNLLRGPGKSNLEIPMFTFYMFVMQFYPAFGSFDWVYKRLKSRRNKKNVKS